MLLVACLWWRLPQQVLQCEAAVQVPILHGTSGDLVLQVQVEVVLDVVVAAPREQAGDEGPAVPVVLLTL